MEEGPGSAKIVIPCSDCGARYAVDVSQLGKKGRCRKCGATFLLKSPDVEKLPSVAQGAAGAVCAVCQQPVQRGEDSIRCPDCKAPYHRECWEYNKGCGVYGCPRAPLTERLESLEIPASYWGREEKNCPVCNQVILAAAIRCRHCGATFASARPETAGDFHKRATRNQALPRVRRTGIWLLVFSILSCTAPFAAVFGVIWYAKHREEIRLPSLHAALCKMAVGIAVGQTALVLVLVLLQEGLGG